MMTNLNSTLFILVCSNALYNTLRGTLARLHWAVYDFVRNFVGTLMWCIETKPIKTKIKVTFNT